VISPALAAKVRSLLVDQKLSQRQVARLTGISRTTVKAIASGEWFDRHRARHGGDDAIPILARCPECGAMVETPCRACEVRRLKKAGRIRPLLATEDGPPRVELRGSEHARYLEVRAAALARGEPDADPAWSPDGNCPDTCFDDDPFSDLESPTQADLASLDSPFETTSEGNDWVESLIVPTKLRRAA
jgi:hypothetical protein